MLCRVDILRHGIEGRSRVVNTHASYSGGPEFKSRLGDRLSEGFHGFPKFLQANAGIVP
jgi:hypothetical protein